MWSIRINAYKFQQHTGLYATFYLPSTFILQIVTMSRFKYAPEQMTAALLACRSQGMGVRKAAQQYAVPRSTLNDKLLGRSPEVRKCGPVTFLTTQVEFLRIVKGKGMVLYSTVSSPLDCSKRFTHNSANY